MNSNSAIGDKYFSAFTVIADLIYQSYDDAVVQKITSCQKHRFTRRLKKNFGANM